MGSLGRSLFHCQQILGYLHVFPRFIDSFRPRCYAAQLDGAVAQLGARLTGSQEVAGSIPASSTNPSFFEVQRFSSFGLHNAFLFSLYRPQIILCDFRQPRLLEQRRSLLMKCLILWRCLNQIREGRDCVIPDS